MPARPFTRLVSLTPLDPGPEGVPARWRARCDGHEFVGASIACAITGVSRQLGPDRLHCLFKPDPCRRHHDDIEVK
jgi:hypothetical protein